MRTTTKITARQTWNKINETGQDPVNGSIALTVIIQHWYANKVEAANTQAQNLKRSDKKTQCHQYHFIKPETGKALGSLVTKEWDKQ